jgi:hypothetical protein
MTAAAFTATYAEWRVIKTRATVQLVFELPIEKADEAYQALGGMPIAAREVWCAIARMSNESVSASVGREATLIAERAEKAEIRPHTSSTPPSSVSRNTAGEAERRKFSDMPYPQQAALRCADPIFQAFLREMCPHAKNAAFARTPEAAAITVRDLCEVESRADIRGGTEAETKWLWLNAWFETWKTKERAMA